ncbi:RodZ domain-containing protein [Dechloromonas denitrificans]|uniref:RodZ domain-containing protein n=1 Tax=Dechloromonas denitrificans TaxID=281362 RepID=UPI001CF8FFE9|nr:RodZ domain-containing protein [Dechloromonas denitrificans]UCV02187.1 helix-turn-helix domain-containing protein [Dechloromonas denitrificans]UCV06529.1 helix-turn-helix domain-containing protein [Dechloromonas denitrificans]
MSEQINADEITAEAAVLVIEPVVGEQLRAARTARGLAVLDIAQALKLGARQVEALENGDWASLPGATFVRGFVRNYARLLQLDPAPLMAQLDSVLEKPVNSLSVPEARPASMPHTGGAASRRDRAVVMAGAGLVVLAGLIYFLIPNDLSALRESTQSLLDSLARKEEPAPAPADPAAAPAEPVFPPGATPQEIINPQAVTPAEVTPASERTEAKPVAPAPGAETTPAPASTAPQMRFVFDKESWLEVRDRDNKLVFSQRVAAGSEQSLSGQGPFSLVVGYAPGVRVFWHGQAVDLTPHMRGDVARFVLE